MSLIRYNHRYDFGHDWYIQILDVKDWSLFQFSISWNDYPTWPYIQVKSGYGSTLSFSFWTYKFGIDIDILSRTWRWDYMDDVDVKETELV